MAPGPPPPEFPRGAATCRRGDLTRAAPPLHRLQAHDPLSRRRGSGRAAAGEGRRLDLATLDPVATRHCPATTRTNGAGASPALLASEPWDLLGSRLRPGLHVDAPTTNERQTNAMKARNYKPLCNGNKVSYVTMSRAIFAVCHVGNPETGPETACDPRQTQYLIIS